MNATYQPTYPVYDGHGAHNYSASIPQQQRVATTTTADVGNHHYTRYPLQSAQQPAQAQQPPLSQPQQSTRQYHLPETLPMQKDSCPSPRPPTPTPTADIAISSQSDTSRQNPENTLVFHSLQIPKCISPNGGNLADFAAQMTCLFWFQSMDNLNTAEAIRSIPSTATLPRLPFLAKPQEQFRKWVLNVLQTTQVTQNVILLALLFIYRLKTSTPQIKGRAGSEYRLLTVALMLGNKFLDDNTYTNKTWADVSCFAVQEIHVMEVEFLSNMRYNLLASKEEWESWLIKLCCFHQYYERALHQPPSPLHIATTAASFQSPISPKAHVLPLVSDLPPYTPTTAKTLSPTSAHSQDWTTFQANAISPLAFKPVRLATAAASRKRSPEYDASDHPAKRQMHPQMAPCILPGNGVYPPACMENRPQMPQLGVVANQAQTAVTPYAATGPSYANKPLPPLQLGARTVAAKFHQAAAGTAAQPHPPQKPPTLASNYPNSTSAVHPSVNLGTPGKRRSPGDLVHYASSPMTEAFSACSAMHTPLALTPLANSPSIYLQQRASPYKPIRHVNRLLAPPSSSLDHYHLSMPVQPSQIHYQPLGRRNEVRTGVVPEFVVYNRQQQHQLHQLPQQSRHQSVYP